MTRLTESDWRSRPADRDEHTPCGLCGGRVAYADGVTLSRQGRKRYGAGSQEVHFYCLRRAKEAEQNEQKDT